MYLVDADVFIQAKNAHYAFDFCPGFWDWLDHAYASGVVASVEKIGQELAAGSDDLAKWAADRQHLFLAPNQDAPASLMALSQWVAQANYRPVARSEFLDSGDLFLIAQAHVLGCVVVTHERAAPDSQKKIKIPDACAAIGVPVVPPWDMLRAEGVRLLI